MDHIYCIILHSYRLFTKHHHCHSSPLTNSQALTMSDSGIPHILVLPYPAQGHMLALLDLTHHLSLRNIAITILVTPKNLPLLHPLLSQNPSIQTLILPFPSHPSVPTGVENVKDMGNHGNSCIISALSRLSQPITCWFRSHPSPPIAILSDFFLGWTHQLASQLGIPRITFYGVGALLTCVSNHLWVHIKQLHPLDPLVHFPHLPNSPVLPKHHLPSVFLRYNKSDPDFEIVKNGFIANTSSFGAVFNTFDHVERDYLEHFKTVVVGHPRVWAVGPIALLGTERGGGGGHVTGAEVFSWLDEFSDGSVVYVSFGSQVFLRREQMEALTKGLEESGSRFILVVRSETYVPDGFEEGVAGRGLVIKGWAPQVDILGHRAVGGFLTHCGWNSVLEGMVAGAVLFCWPMEADQFVNAKWLVEYIGGGVRVCEGKTTVLDSGELARCLNEFTTGMEPEKKRAMELRDKALNAVKHGGTSEQDLDGLVQAFTTLAANSTLGKETM